MLSAVLKSLASLFWPPAAARSLRRGAAPVAVNATAAAPAAPQPARPDLATVQQLIGKVTAMTSAVANDVGSHNANIEAISAELTAVAQSDPTAVAAIVCKLLVANRELQGRLRNSEASLRTHSQQLSAAVTSARTDELTGLMNRRALDEELQRCLDDFQRRGLPSALFMLDVDQFKKFNDSFGHIAGDQVLAHTAKLLHNESAPTDIVCRFGGEEFAVLFKGATTEQVRERAEALRQSIGKQAIEFGIRQFHVTASAGLAQLTPGMTIAQWIEEADRALYAAKNGGRDCAFQVRGAANERITRAAIESTQAPAQQPIVAAAVDPAPRPAAEASVELAAEAFTDTNFVPNIARRIAEWRRGGATLTVALLRLDDPQREDQLNDSDETQSPIRMALQVARLCVREMDVVTRWQSDGLAFMLPNTSAGEAKMVARRLRATLAANNSGGERPRLSICIGIAEGIEGNDARRVLERAWQALDTARKTGSGNIYIHDGLKAVAVRLAPSLR
jgi:diguanylate cyclase